MALLAVFEHDVELTARDGAVVLTRQGNPFQTIPAHQVDEVHLHGGAGLTVAGRNFLLARGVDVVFLTLDGRVRGRLVGAESAWAARRLAQYRVVTDTDRRLALARRFVEGKLRNQMDLVRRRQAWMKLDGLAEAVLLLRAQLERVEGATTLDALRGVEGFAASVYFDAFGLMLGPSGFTWAGRSRRPPLDPPNAALSFGYTLLCTRVESAVRRAGLDPYLGLLHETHRGAPALALDLAEELRPLVDDVVLTLFNRRQLGPEDFGPPRPEDVVASFPEGVPEAFASAVHLSDVGRKIMTRTWALRLAERAPHPTAEGDWTLSGLMVEQAHQLRRVLEGEAAQYVAARVP